MIAPVSPRTPIIGGRRYNELVHHANANTFRFNPNHFRVQGGTVSLASNLGAGAGSSTTVPWAITISGTTATVAAGSIKFRGTYYNAAAQAVTVNGGLLATPDYIVASFTLSTLTLAIAANSVSTIPTDTSNILYFVLHEVYRSGATALHKRQRMNSDIITVATFG